MRVLVVACALIAACGSSDANVKPDPAGSTARSASSASSSRPQSQEALVAATLEAIRTDDADAIEALFPKAEDLQAACPDDKPKKREGRLEKLRQSVAACHALLGPSRATVVETKGGEEREGTTCVKAHRDVNVQVDVGDKKFTVTLDDPLHVEGHGYWLVDPVGCAESK